MTRILSNIKLSKKLVAGIVVVVILGWIGLSAAGGQGQQAARAKPAVLDEQPITITAKGYIVPAAHAKLGFKTSGRVESILVKEGDWVKQGQALAKLDATDLGLQLKAAHDALRLNEALLNQAKSGARPEEIEAAEAGFQSALAKYNETVGGARDPELKAAEAALESAKEKLAQTQAAVEADEVAGQAAVDSAQAKLNQSKAGPKPEELQAAELQLDQAKNTLWSTQVDRDGLKGAFGAKSYQGQAADARVASAETAVQIAEANLLKMRKGPSQEDITIAEAAVLQAESQLKAKRTTAEAALAAAQSAVDSAESKLAQLREGPTKADKELAGSSLASAKANLQIKKAGASQADVEVALARVEQARTSVKQAESALAGTTLEAPFDGVVASLQLRKGELATAGSQAIILGDTGNFQVETSDLDEAGAAKIQVGQPVDVVVNAFDDKVLKGTVAAIAHYATITANGDANYTATIALEQPDSSLRWGMTAKVDFGVEK